MKKIKILFYPSEERVSKKSRQIPIYLRISRGSTKTEVRLPIQITEAEIPKWDKFEERLPNSSVSSKEVNAKISEIKESFEALRYTHKERYEQMHPQEVKDLLLKVAQLSEQSVLLNEIKSFFCNSVLNNTNFVSGTIKNYQKSINHFEKYLKHIGKSQITISLFTAQLAYGFYEYLQKKIPEIGKASISDVSASSVLIKIKVIFNRWVDTEIIRRNPFKKVKLQTKTIKRDPLSCNEIKKIKEYDFSNEPKLEVYRDLFMFQVYTGLAYGDVFDLNRSNIEELSNGDYILIKKRKKTKVEMKQVLNSGAIEIIKKYREHYEIKISDRLLPQRHLNNLNEALKVIQARVGIKKLMTSHIARHTCAQFIAECDIREDVMDKIMGWSNGRQGSRADYCIVTDSRLKEAKSKFENYLNQSL